MPVGIARDADPDLGLSFDPLVLGVGFLVVAVGTIGVAALSAWRAGTFAARDRGHRCTTTRALVGSGVRRRLTAPVARPLGVRMALEPGRGATAVPVRSAAIGAVLGVVGVVGSLVFAASLSTTVDRAGTVRVPVGCRRRRVRR